MVNDASADANVFCTSIAMASKKAFKRRGGRLGKVMGVGGPNDRNDGKGKRTNKGKDSKEIFQGPWYTQAQCTWDNFTAT